MILDGAEACYLWIPNFDRSFAVYIALTQPSWEAAVGHPPAGRAGSQGEGEMPGSMREIASTFLFDTTGRFLFQQRDNIAGITEPGKIGLFGGHKEGNETFLECISREVSEEISINLPLERFQPLTVYEDIDLEVGGPIRAEFFVARNISLAQIRITEGCLVVANAENVPRSGSA
jgi:8-oxo-dGTP pyrophosphatase MutT (NUDIX family)